MNTLKSLIPNHLIIRGLLLISLTSCVLFFYPKIASAAGLFSRPKADARPKVDKNAPSETTIKTIPDNSVQTLVVPKDSPYSGLYLQALNDPNINSAALNSAFKFFLKHKDNLITKDLCLGKDNISNTKKIRNQNCLVIADYTKSKLEPRLHIFKFNENKIYNLHTAHGKGSNTKEKDLVASKFSNTPNSLQTSLGFFLTDVSYSSGKPTFGPGPNNGIKLDGLSCTTNNARRRFIVMHTARYVTDEIKDEDSIGYSEGCITLPPSQKDLMLTCTGGALVYTHAQK
jgi:hypothetical protein